MAKKALVVDDSLVMRQMVSFTLRDAGLEVEAASNGEEALKLVEKQNFDLIVTDLNMPVMDGITFIRSADAIAGQPLYAHHHAYHRKRNATETARGCCRCNRMGFETLRPAQTFGGGLQGVVVTAPPFWRVSIVVILLLSYSA